MISVQTHECGEIYIIITPDEISYYWDKIIQWNHISTQKMKWNGLLLHVDYILSISKDFFFSLIFVIFKDKAWILAACVISGIKKKCLLRISQSSNQI